MSSIYTGSREGYAIIVDPSATTMTRESGTFDCCHCQMTVHMHFGSGVKRGYCPMCNAPTCGLASCNKDCVPFMRKIEAAENRFRLRRALERGYDK